MRSRFTAFSVGDTAHLLRSWHPDTRPPSISIDTDQRWSRLEVIETDAGRALDATGTVEFIAHYETPAGPGSLHERSRFSRVDGAWVYVAG
jgi:SEC-C motif-containing protein